MTSLGPEFYKKLVEMSNELGMKPEDILNVMAVESGLNPSAHNQNGNASGLVQVMPSTLKGIGFKGTHSDFRNLKAEQQLDYIKQLIRSNIKYNGGPFKSAAQYYVSNFIPAALKIPGIKNEIPSTIIVARNPEVAHVPHVDIATEAKYYMANKGLDVDNDGAITFGDIQRVLAQKAKGKDYQQALMDLKNYANYNPSIEVKQDKHENLFSNFLKKFKSDNDIYSKLEKKMPTSNDSNQIGKSMPSENNINNILDNYIRMISASNKKLYKKSLPCNNITIQVKTSNKVDAIEFSRILSSALEEELLAEASTHMDDENVEVVCAINGPKEVSLKAVQSISDIISDQFKYATNKIGGITVKAYCNMNKLSSYKQISAEDANSNYRKFLLKFKGK